MAKDGLAPVRIDAVHAIVTALEVIVQTIQHLEGHTFLDLPLRAGRSWSTSEVVL